MITLYWSRVPGKFVNKNTGENAVIPEGLMPKFTGSVREWYETLIETCIDARNQCVRLKKISTGQGSKVTLRVGPDVHCMLQASVLYHSDGTLGSLFTVKEDKGLTNRIIVGDRGKAVASVIVKDM